MKFGKLLISIVIVSLLVSMAIPMAAAPKPDNPGGGGGKPPKDPPDPTPATPAIAYTTRDMYSLWVMDADGSHQTLIYVGDEKIGKPTWAPDGSAIAFMMGINEMDLWRIDVSLVDGVPVGSNPTMLYSNIWWNVEWSPDGEVLLFPEMTPDPNTWHLRTIPALGGEPTTLYTADSGFEIMDPTWSRDGSSIAYVHGEWLATGWDNFCINVFDVASTEVTTVYGPVSKSIWWLEWGKEPDSTEIVFTMRLPDGGFGIYTIDTALTDPTPFLVEGGDSRFPSWSPDDSQVVAYTVTTPTKKGRLKSDTNIWVEDIATGDRTELANGWALDWKR